MIPTKVTAENVATYGKLEWEIPSGLSSILGRNELSDGADSNGAGKSTLLSLVPLALFGPSLPWSEILAKGEESCRVELLFEHDTELYRVRRTYSGKGRGKTSLDFERNNLRDEVDERGERKDSWIALTQESQVETQVAITCTIGLSEETFSHSVFAAQGARHFASPELQPRERKQVLAEVLDLGSWDVLLELVRTDLRADEAEVAALTLRLGDLEAEQESEAELREQLAQATGTVEQTTAAVKVTETAHEGARTLLQTVEQAQRDRVHLESQARLCRERLTGLKAQVEVTGKAREEIATLTGEADVLAETAATVDALEQQLREGEAAAARVSEQAARRDDAVARIGELRRLAESSRQIGAALKVQGLQLKERRDDLAGKGVGVCRECGQQLVGDALGTAVASLDAELAGLREQLQAANQDVAEKESAALAAEHDLPAEPDQLPDLAPLRMRVQEAHGAQVTLAAQRVRLLDLEEKVAVVEGEGFQGSLVEAEVALGEADAALAAVEPVSEQRVRELNVALGEAARALDVARVSLQSAQQEQTRLEERLRSVAQAAERAQEALAARARLNTRLDLLKALEAAYGRNGIPALILETSAIPQLEAEAQRILAELGVPYRVELVTQRETKTGTLKDTLDVVVHEPAGPRRYETYSGGEQTRLEFALRIALARLVASRHGSESGLLALDEMPYLDASGTTQVASVLRSLDEFRSVLLISHDDKLSDSFDQQIMVVRDEDGSRLEEVHA